MFKLTAIKEKSVGKMFGIGGSSGSSGAASAAAAAQNQSTKQMIDFLKQQQSVSKPIQDKALRQYEQAVYGQPTTEQLLQRAQGSGLYDALLSGQEEAAMRAQSAAGNLRGGGTLAGVGRVQNQALLQSFANEQNREQQRLSNLSNLSGMGPNYTGQIAGGINQMGTNTAQGIIAEAQNKAAGQQAGFGNLMGLGQLGLGAYSAGLFSDDRLKANIEHTGYENGIPTYQWEWNEKAADLNLYGKSYGTLASEVEKVRPDAVSVKDGFKVVNYDMIGVKHGDQ